MTVILILLGHFFKIGMNNALFILKNTLYNIGCPKCYIINFLSILIFAVVFIKSYHSLDQMCLCLLILPFQSLSLKRIKGYDRIGPHSKHILSIIFGSLLGKGEIHKKKDGTYIVFFQEAAHVKYLL